MKIPASIKKKVPGGERKIPKTGFGKNWKNSSFQSPRIK